MKYFSIFLVFISYSLIVSCDVNESNLSDISIENPTLLSQQKETSQMVSSNDDCDSPSCWEVYQLEAPTLSSPQNSSFEEKTVSFNWQKPPSNPSFTRYELIVYNSTSTYSFDDLNTESKVVSNLQRNETWYWKVKAYDPSSEFFPCDGCYGPATSSTRSVRIRPERPTLNGSIQAGSPKITFNKNGYAVEIDRTSQITPYSGGTDIGFQSYTSGYGTITYVDNTHYENLELSNSFSTENAVYSIRYINSQGWESQSSVALNYIPEGNGGFGF